MLRAIRHRLEFLVFQILCCLVDCLSPRATVWLAERLAWVLHDVLPRRWTRYHVSRENVKHAFGDQLTEEQIDRMIYGMWVHLFRTVAEIVQAPRKLNLQNYRKSIHFADFTRTNEALLSGRPVIVLGGHFGNWEICPALFGMWGWPLGVVAREMDNPYLQTWFQQARERAGHRLLPKSGGYDDMLEMLRRGGNLAMLCDQDAGPRGLFVDFFGRPASTFKSIALLALEYDALIIVGYTLRKPDNFDEAPWFTFEVGCEIQIDPRTITSTDPVGEITRQFTAALELAIRRAPEQYFWVHRRWKSQPRARSVPLPQRMAG